jgi:hypothetical protein
MAYVALNRIHVFLRDDSEARRWLEAFEDAGGEEAVAGAWIEAIEASLAAMSASSPEIGSDDSAEEG